MLSSVRGGARLRVYTKYCQLVSSRATRKQMACGASRSQPTSLVTPPLAHVDNDSWMFCAPRSIKQAFVFIVGSRRQVDTQVPAARTTLTVSPTHPSIDIHARKFVLGQRRRSIVYAPIGTRILKFEPVSPLPYNNRSCTPQSTPAQSSLDLVSPLSYSNRSCTPQSSTQAYTNQTYSLLSKPTFHL